MSFFVFRICVTCFFLLLVLLLIMFFFFFIFRPTPSSTLFPYTTLFRSDRPRPVPPPGRAPPSSSSRWPAGTDRKSTRLYSSHLVNSYAVFCLKKKKSEPYTLPSTFSHC